MNPVIIIQARINSRRTPGKILLPIAGKPILQHVIERCQRTGLPVVVAAGGNETYEAVKDLCAKLKADCVEGSESDVLGRYLQVATEYRADPIIRITADCPMVPVALISKLRELYTSSMPDYYAVSVNRDGAMNYPDGFDCEFFSYAALCDADENATEPQDREHVTPYIQRNRQCLYLEAKNGDARGVKFSVDIWSEYLKVKDIMEGRLYREKNVITYWIPPRPEKESPST